MEEIKCEKCGKEFGSVEAREMHIKAKHPEDVKEAFLAPKRKQKIKNWGIVIFLIAVIAFTFYFISSTAKILPPTDMRGHVELSPPSHVLKEPMPINIQKHMLEHADGSGAPGVIINYNCIDYECESDLIEKLEAFAEKYSNVYVAPFPDMDAKIALTKLGMIEILEEYDENRIESFI